MTNRNIIIAAVLSGAVITGAVIAVACSALETPDKIDLASTYTTVAASSEPEPESTAAPTTAPETSGQAEGAGEQAESITLRSKPTRRAISRFRDRKSVV